MPGVVTAEFRTIHTINFVDSIDYTQDENTTESDIRHVYLGIGRQDAWPNDANNRPEYDRAFKVPEPSSDDPTHIYDFWDNIISAIRIYRDEISPVLIRKDYQSNFMYNVGDVVVSIHNNEYYVYECKEVGYVAGTTEQSDSTYKPVGYEGNVEDTNNPGNILPGLFHYDDGYSWQFLYDMNEFIREKFMTSLYLPVPFGSGTTILQNTYGKENAISIAKCRHVMMKKKLDDSLIPNKRIRQIALMLDPELNAEYQNDTALARDFIHYGETVADEYILTNAQGEYIIPTLKEDSGSIFYLENRLPLNRSDDQVEEIRLIVEF